MQCFQSDSGVGPGVFPPSSSTPRIQCNHAFQVKKPSTHSLALEGSDGLVPLLNIVVDSLELGKDLLGLSDGSSVLEDVSVVRKVDLRGRGLQSGISVNGRGVSSSERLESVKRLLSETQLGVDLGPVL